VLNFLWTYFPSQLFFNLEGHLIMMSMVYREVRGWVGLDREVKKKSINVLKSYFVILVFSCHAWIDLKSSQSGHNILLLPQIHAHKSALFKRFTAKLIHIMNLFRRSYTHMVIQSSCLSTLCRGRKILSGRGCQKPTGHKNKCW